MLPTFSTPYQTHKHINHTDNIDEHDLGTNFHNKTNGSGLILIKSSGFSQ